MTILLFGFFFFDSEESLNAGNDRSEETFLLGLPLLVAPVLISWALMPSLAFVLVAVAFLLIVWALVSGPFGIILVVLV